MMNTTDEMIRFSIKNTLESVDLSKRFPCQVFKKKWDGYLFFEPYNMFEEQFILFKDFILQKEVSNVLTLVNINSFSSNMRFAEALPYQYILLNVRTEYSEYMSMLMGDGAPTNWMFSMDRYACASDKGAWVIYCEKENDIAVFAFQNSAQHSILPGVQKILRASPISSEAKCAGEAKFDFGKLVSEWQNTLRAEYS